MWNFGTIFKRAALLCLSTVVSACSGFFFYPQKTLLRTPADLGLTYEDVVVSRDGLSLHGWLLKAEQPHGIIFFLHGNAENISTHIASVFWLPEQGYDVLLIDYRGYGQSQGVPDFPEVFGDVEAFYEWLSDYAGQRQLPVTLLGQSLGAAIGSYFAANLSEEKNLLQGVVLDAVFSGHRDIAREALSKHVLTWPLQFIVPWFLPGNYDPADHIAHISPTPLLMMHSVDDQVLPYKQGRRVFEQAAGPKYFVSTHGTHISTFSYPRNREILLNFLAHPSRDPSQPLH